LTVRCGTGLKELELTFYADSGMLQGKDKASSGLLNQALDQVLLKGFKLPELSLSRFTFICGDNIKNMNVSEGFGFGKKNNIAVAPLCTATLVVSSKEGD